jgi:hypothetical protein
MPFRSAGTARYVARCPCCGAEVAVEAGPPGVLEFAAAEDPEAVRDEAWR